MKFNDISVVILFYKTSYEVIKNLSNYKNFNIYILDQSNDVGLKKKKLKKNFLILNIMKFQIKIMDLRKVLTF